MVRGVERSPGPGVPTLPVPVLRARLEHQLAQVSLRQAAREIGLSPNALRNFISGSSPRRTSRVQMERWLARRPSREPRPTLSRFLTLMDDLTPDLPQREAVTLGRDMSRLLLAAYERRRLPPPRWVKELARHYDPGGT